MTSPLLDLPGAVAGDGLDAPVAAHYGSFNNEQRALVQGEGFVDLSHRDVLTISGPDRLTWLHSLTSQHLENLQPGQPTQTLVLSPNGHVEHHVHLVDDGETVTAHTEPGRGEALVGWLDRMRFMSRVEVAAEPGRAVCWRPQGERGKYDVLDRADLQKYAEAAGPPAGLWAFEALRIERGEPRIGLDTDERTIPNEVGWVGTATTPEPSEGAVHLEKGCYRGQETVARVHTLGRPPRRLTLLHLDGSENRLPAVGDKLVFNDREIGFVGTSARHHELGPVALALVKRNVPLDAQLDCGGLPVAQEVIVDPEVGLHVRPLRD